ncbi:MAG TPA: hypothetical protein PKE39_06115 [Ignavibacteria bacterium]|nr:hypothetical protein [Ignavibacteria bacterium]HMQ98581.1 hypothetical protein [Ignavibacteria bacterium]
MNKPENLNRGIAKFNLLSLLILLAAILFSISNTYSQQDNGEKKQRKTPEERAQKRADKMKEKLSLTEDQHKQVYDIMLSQANEIKTVWNLQKTIRTKPPGKKR